MLLVRRPCLPCVIRLSIVPLQMIQGARFVDGVKAILPNVLNSRRTVAARPLSTTPRTSIWHGSTRGPAWVGDPLEQCFFPCLLVASNSNLPPRMLWLHIRMQHGLVLSVRIRNRDLIVPNKRKSRVVIAIGFEIVCIRVPCASRLRGTALDNKVAQSQWQKS